MSAARQLSPQPPQLCQCKDCGSTWYREFSFGHRPDRCGPCDQAHRSRSNQASGARYRAENAATIRLAARNAYVLKKYGTTQADLDALLEGQGGTCAICHTTQPGDHWHTDHCHTSGMVRGILCQLCNMGLGHFRDDIERLLDAAAYLEGARA